MPDKKKQVNTRFEPQTGRKIEQIATQRNTTNAEVVRDLVDDGLKVYEGRIELDGSEIREELREVRARLPRTDGGTVATPDDLESLEQRLDTIERRGETHRQRTTAWYVAVLVSALYLALSSTGLLTSPATAALGVGVSMALVGAAVFTVTGRVGDVQ